MALCRLIPRVGSGFVEKSLCATRLAPMQRELSKIEKDKEKNMKDKLLRRQIALRNARSVPVQVSEESVTLKREAFPKRSQKHAESLFSEESVEDHSQVPQKELPTVGHVINRAMETCVLCTQSAIYLHIVALMKLIERNNGAVYSMDYKCKPSLSGPVENPIAILILSDGRQTMIIQLAYIDSLALKLKSFLEDSRILKVGHNVTSGACKLYYEYGIRVRGLIDIPALATNLGIPTAQTPQSVAKSVLGTNIYLAKRVLISNWEVQLLHFKQAIYAVLDPFVNVAALKLLYDRFGKESCLYDFVASHNGLVGPDGVPLPREAFARERISQPFAFAFDRPLVKSQLSVHPQIQRFGRNDLKRPTYNAMLRKDEQGALAPILEGYLPSGVKYPTKPPVRGQTDTFESEYMKWLFQFYFKPFVPVFRVLPNPSPKDKTPRHYRELNIVDVTIDGKVRGKGVGESRDEAMFDCMRNVMYQEAFSGGDEMMAVRKRTKTEINTKDLLSHYVRLRYFVTPRYAVAPGSRQYALHYNCYLGKSDYILATSIECNDIKTGRNTAAQFVCTNLNIFNPRRPYHIPLDRILPPSLNSYLDVHWAGRRLSPAVAPVQTPEELQKIIHGSRLAYDEKVDPKIREKFMAVFKAIEKQSKRFFF